MKRSLNCPHDRSTTDCSLASQTTRYEWMLLYEEATFCAIRCSSREGATWMQDKVGKLLSLPRPYHARIVTMRRWGDGLGYEANDDVTWLLLIDVWKEKESAFRVCLVNLPPSHSLFCFQWPHLLGGPIVVSPRLYPAPRMAMMEPKILPSISV